MKTLLALLLLACSATAGQVCITIHDDDLTRARDAFCVAQDYTNKKLPAETKAQFVQRTMASWVKAQCVLGEAMTARKAAAQTANQQLRITP